MAEQNAIVMDLSGDQELFFTLVALPNAVQDRVAKTAFRNPANRIMKTARDLAPVSRRKKSPDRPKRGYLRSQIKVRSLPRSRSRVGVRVGTSSVEFTGKAFYAYFQEYGWKQGKRQWRSHKSTDSLKRRLAELKGILANQENTPSQAVSAKKKLQFRHYVESLEKQIQFREKSDRRRQIPPKFFFRRAFDAHKNITAQEMRKNIIEAIEIETKRLQRAHIKKILNPTVKGAAQEDRAFRLLTA